jgi:hypothetical protein
MLRDLEEIALRMRERRSIPGGTNGDRKIQRMVSMRALIESQNVDYTPNIRL